VLCDSTGQLASVMLRQLPYGEPKKTVGITGGKKEGKEQEKKESCYHVDLISSESCCFLYGLILSP